ncbi:unnamed protein product [Sphagnum jensenii]|uniref:N-acetyltransferase domain-containing protein n=1 Tax=Sphagnum jensenii TaxID=128206 RepID=A0ABP0VE74_9BRYO
MSVSNPKAYYGRGVRSDWIHVGLRALNEKLAQRTPRKNIVLEYVEEQGRGGIVAFVHYDVLHIEALFVESAARKRGVGRDLVIEAERLGRLAGANHAWVDTFSWLEAEGFYLKLGYSVFGVLPYKHGEQYRAFLAKSL